MIPIEEHNTAYAYKNNQLVHISDVSSGLGCGCVCVVCNKRLIAKKGRVRVHHFSHVAQTNCVGAAETTLHLVSKELLCSLPHILLPPYLFNRMKRLRTGLTVKHEVGVVKGGKAVITNANSEQHEYGFTPDVTLESNSKILFVEIAVTHKVDRAKLRQIRKRGLPAIEIHLDLKDATLNRSELAIKIQDDIGSKCWLFHPKQRKAEQEYINKVRRALRRSREPAIRFQENVSFGTEPQITPSLRINGRSRAKTDRLYYEYYLKHGRQAYSEDELD